MGTLDESSGAFVFTFPECGRSCLSVPSDIFARTRNFHLDSEKVLSLILRKMHAWCCRRSDNRTKFADDKRMVSTPLCQQGFEPGMKGCFDDVVVVPADLSKRPPWTVGGRSSAAGQDD